MLTKEDIKLLEKSTRKIVREEVETEGKNTRQELSHNIRVLRMELSTRIDSLDSRTKKLEVSNQKILKEIGKVKKNLKETSNFLDIENIKAVKRVRALEVHLGFPEPEVI